MKNIFFIWWWFEFLFYLFGMLEMDITLYLCFRLHRENSRSIWIGDYSKKPHLMDQAPKTTHGAGAALVPLQIALQFFNKTTIFIIDLPSRSFQYVSQILIKTGLTFAPLLQKLFS